MKSLQEFYRIGKGPSSSHTMGPYYAGQNFRKKHPAASHYRVDLYGSLAMTGRGHLTDMALYEGLEDENAEVVFHLNKSLSFHPNGMKLSAYDTKNELIASEIVYSIGGGALHYENNTKKTKIIYSLHTMEEILKKCIKKGWSFWEIVEYFEGDEIWSFLNTIWDAMSDALQRGLKTEGVLPGGLGLSRKSWAFHRKSKMAGGSMGVQTGYLSAYALAVSEENATGGLIVTAPTAGACGVLPAVLQHMKDRFDCSHNEILRALATAGLVGNLVKHNASISGAEVGCQGEIGVACAMAAAASAQLMGGTVRQIEYAAEMGLEHHLGLTCDPVGGLVQIPCIERNVFGATRAIDAANYAVFTDGSHRISFDEVVQVMKQTGHDLPNLYRETSSGGLAAVYRHEKDKE